MEGGYVQWQKEVMEEAHNTVLKRKRVCDDEIIPVPDKIRDYNTWNIFQCIQNIEKAGFFGI